MTTKTRALIGAVFLTLVGCVAATAASGTAGGTGSGVRPPANVSADHVGGFPRVRWSPAWVGFTRVELTRGTKLVYAAAFESDGRTAWTGSRKLRHGRYLLRIRFRNTCVPTTPPPGQAGDTACHGSVDETWSFRLAVGAR